jgi:uncharacterized NAD-dependent epimerase/dehydratase family protein
MTVEVGVTGVMIIVEVEAGTMTDTEIMTASASGVTAAIVATDETGMMTGGTESPSFS